MLPRPAAGGNLVRLLMTLSSRQAGVRSLASCAALCATYALRSSPQVTDEQAGGGYSVQAPDLATLACLTALYVLLAQKGILRG